MRILSAALAAGFVAIALAAAATAADGRQPTLLGRAILPADAYQPGPPSGAFVLPNNGVTPPFPGQPIPGFSAVLNAGHGRLWAMPDNGYGAKTDSSDFLLRVYRIRPHFETAGGGSGRVDVLGFIQLRDPDGKIPFPLTRDDRLLTGADFDIESLRRARDGSFWFGDEFGPFLLHTSATGRVLEAPIALPGVQSPQNPFLPDPDAWTLRASRGFEAMARSIDGRTLYPMLEGALRNDPDPLRRILHEFDLRSRAYTGRTWQYRVDPAFPDAVIGDLTALDRHRFVLIERDDAQGAEARQKKVYLVDLRVLDAEGYLKKQLVLDLLYIRDPEGISLPARPGEFGVGDPFAFPLQSVESLEVLRRGRLLVANDNNYPSSDGRWIARDRPDDTELIVVQAFRAATAVKPYVEPVGEEYEIRPLLSVADAVPETSHPSRQYQMVGIPDGLGAHASRKGTTTLFMNHEFEQSTVSEPLVGGPLNRGAFVSKWILDEDGEPVSGERAYDRVFMENTFVGPAAEVGNSTPAFARFCSGFLAGRAHGFDRWIYFANEEEDSPITFDGKGGLSIAIYDNEAHALPKLGHIKRENTLVQPGRGTRTVIFPLEDGPATLDNQLYMYVGKKKRSAKASVLSRNGLDTGRLFVFRALDPGRNSERMFVSGSVTGEWVEIPNAENLTDVELEAASDAVNAMTFVRPEDGAFNTHDRNEFFFVTTGSSSGADEGVNELGRLYSLRLHPGNPLRRARLTIVYNADTVVAAGGDTALSPDNIDTSRKYLMINEDGTTETRAVMAAKGRDGSIWRFDLVKGRRHAVGVDASTGTRVAELNPPGRDGIPVGPGVWETSGIIDTSHLFGRDTWLSDVQAHPPTTAPAPNTVEDGQLFLMTPAD